jgi:hypothetical protein
LIIAFVNADYRLLTAIIALQIQQHFLCFISRVGSIMILIAAAVALLLQTL